MNEFDDVKKNFSFYFLSL